MKISWIVGVIAFTLVNAAIADIPSSVLKCTHGDSSCLVQSTQNIITNYAKTGIKEINLVPFDPLRVKTLKLERNPQSPVNIELLFKDIDVIGLANAKVVRINGFTSTPNSVNEVELTVPQLILKGPYSINGNVLILPVVGSGNSEVILENVSVSYKSKSKLTVKNDKEYLNTENVKLDIKPKHVTYKFENLFNGNKELGDNMNRFVNENWSEIFSEIQPAVAEAFGLIVKHLMNSVFSKHPYEQYFEH